MYLYSINLIIFIFILKLKNIDDSFLLVSDQVVRGSYFTKNKLKRKMHHEHEFKFH